MSDVGQRSKGVNGLRVGPVPILGGCPSPAFEFYSALSDLQNKCGCSAADGYTCDKTACPNILNRLFLEFGFKNELVSMANGDSAIASRER